MNWLFVLIAAVLIAVAQYLWAPVSLDALSVRTEGEGILAEPGEEGTLRLCIENRSRFPALFVRVKAWFPTGVALVGEKAVQPGLQNQSIEERFSLLPLRCMTRPVRYVCGERGAVELGGCRVSAGDLLGFRENTRDWPPLELVVMPRRSRDRRALEAVGGFLGDISVRRFILEDPVLTVGFREYTGREPLKSISWTRTATSGTMQVKQFDHTAEQTVVVLLNVSGAGKRELEECFSLTRSVCEELEKKKIPFGLRTNGCLPTPTGNLLRLHEGLGASHLSAILYGLGRADDTCYLSLRTLVRQTVLARKNHESYIVITPAPDESGRRDLRELERTGARVCVLSPGEEGMA